MPLFFLSFFHELLIDCSGAGRQTLGCQGSISAAGNHAACPSPTQQFVHSTKPMEGGERRREKTRERVFFCRPVMVFWSWRSRIINRGQGFDHLRAPLRRLKRSRTRPARHLSFNLGYWWREEWGLCVWGEGGLAVHSWPRCFPQLIVLLVGFSCVSWAQQTPAAALKLLTDTHFWRHCCFFLSLINI